MNFVKWKDLVKFMSKIHVYLMLLLYHLLMNKRLSIGTLDLVGSSFCACGWSDTACYFFLLKYRQYLCVFLHYFIISLKIAASVQDTTYFLLKMCKLLIQNRTDLNCSVRKRDKEKTQPLLTWLSYSSFLDVFQPFLL